jgi:hypothetical protein
MHKAPEIATALLAAAARPDWSPAGIARMLDLMARTEAFLRTPALRRSDLDAVAPAARALRARLAARHQVLTTVRDAFKHAQRRSRALVATYDATGRVG